MSLILKYDLGNPHRLPVGYTPLAYIESTGTQYINTGWVPGVDSKIDVKIIPTTNSGTNPITCIATSDNKLIFECFLTNNYGTLYYAVNGSQGSTTNTLGSTASGNFSGPLHCIYTTDKFICNGVTLVSSTKPTLNGTSQNCILLAYTPANGSIDSRHMSCKLYSFKGFDGETLIRDFIPAKRNSDGVVGMFDIVSQTFKTNAGTGAFIAGPEVVVLPHEYLLVEYLESEDNVNCYINTGFAPNNNTRLTTSIYPTSARTDAHFWFGSRNGSSTSLAFVFYQSGIATGGLNAAWNTSGNVGISQSGQKWYNIDFNKNILQVNGTTAHTFTAGTFTGTYPIFLFAMNTSGSMDGLKGGLKLGITKIYNNGTISRNMIPCYRRSDLKPGMYDTVNNVFYTNAGSGEFILGPVVEESSRQLEYNNAGSNYIGKPINIHHSISNPSTTQINLGSGNFNTNSWIKLPQLQNLVNGSISFWLKVNTLKNVVIVGNEDELYYLGATRNGTGAWYHHNCGTITTYVDGVVKTTPTADTNWHHIVFTGVNLSAWTTAYLNKYISESSGWNVNGCYYDFRIYDNVLTAEEVLKIYKGGL